MSFMCGYKVYPEFDYDSAFLVFDVVLIGLITSTELLYFVFQLDFCFANINPTCAVIRTDSFPFRQLVSDLDFGKCWLVSLILFKFSHLIT